VAAVEQHTHRCTRTPASKLSCAAAVVPVRCFSHRDGGGRRSTVRDLVGVVGSGAGEVVQVVAGAGVAGRDSAAAGTRDGEAAGRAPSPCEFGDLGFTGAAVETLLRGK
jgi:hypothetical protein